MTRLHAGAVFSVGAVIALHLAPAANAQYDSSGRYVPSPMGKPSDPYRSSVPGYTGTPGGTKRFAPTPRGFQVQPLKIPPFTPRQDRQTTTAPLPAVYPTRADCKAGWSRDSALPKVRFARACRFMLGRKNE